MTWLRLLLLCLLSGPALGQAAPAPVVRTAINPAKGVVLGQPVTLDVEVLFPGEMMHPPLVTIPEAAGAQILRFETQATTMRERIGDQDYAGQSFEFVLFPRRGGEIAIPAPAVTLLDRGGNVIGTAKGEPMRIAVTVPPGVDPSGPVLAADRVSVEQSWSPDPRATRFKPGSAVVRSIRRQADGVPALGMAEFSFAAPEGVRVYVDPPVVEDRSNRGSVEGHRTDKVTYVFERAGSYDLPPLVQPWWSISDRAARVETLPGVSITVSTVPAATADRTRREYAWIILGFLCLAATALLAVGGVRLARAWHSRKERYQASAEFARRQLLQVAPTGDAELTYRALLNWRRRLSPAELAVADHDPALATASRNLGQAIFATGGTWNRTGGLALEQAVAGCGRACGTDTASEQLLPPLNPGVKGQGE